MSEAVLLPLVVVAAALGAYLGWVLWSNRRAGASGLVRTSRLTCPKCSGSFEYSFVPGASMSSLRLGRNRFMVCPLCHRWSVIRLMGNPGGRPETRPPSA